MIKVTNPLLPFEPSKGEKNPNHMIAGTAVNGEAEIRLVIPPGETATVKGSQTLKGVIPIWVWSKFRDSTVGTNYIKNKRLIVEGDEVSDKIISDHEAEVAAAAKQKASEERAAAKAVKDAEKTSKSAENSDATETKTG